MDEHERSEPKQKKSYKKFILLDKKWIIGMIVFILVLFSFYWFSLRSTLAKRNCDNYARDVSRGSEITDKPGKYYYSKSNYDFAYKGCLHQKGF